MTVNHVSWAKVARCDGDKGVIDAKLPITPAEKAIADLLYKHALKGAQRGHCDTR